MQTYLFYDLETSGLNPSFDQILQFAAIRTDTQLNELKRYEIHCQLRPDIIPHLSAVLTHRISPLAASNQSLNTEREAIQQIHELVNEPGTVSVGYNTLSFDDEVLRFSFFRNLLPPYTHQFSNNCSRMDLLPITVFYYLFAPDSLSWPYNDSKVSLKLEDLNAENNWVEGQAHNAMVDVEVTIKLAQQLQQSTDIWNFCRQYFSKQQDQLRFTNWSLSKQQALWVDHHLGADQQFMAPVVYLGQHQRYRNQALFVRLDHKDLSQIPDDQWRTDNWVFKKKWAEPGFLLPIKDHYINRLSPERRELAQANWEWLQNNPAYWKDLQDYYLNYKYPIEPQADTDSVLYQHGFISDEDQAISQDFHKHKADLMLQLQFIDKFTTSELRELAWRLLIRNHYSYLPEHYKQQAKDFFQYQLTGNIIDYRQRAKYNLAMAKDDWLSYKANQSSLDDEQRRLLVDFQQFLNSKQGD